VRKVFGVPRGGVPAALALVNAMNQKLHARVVSLVDVADDADLLVDDLVDSGATRDRVRSRLQRPFASLITKRAEQDVRDGYLLYGDERSEHEWIVFPWEATVQSSAEDIFIRLLEFIGENPNREGLKETPARAIRAWREWTQGYAYAPTEVLKSFEDGANNYDEMVLVRSIPVYSHCEHHLAPFFGFAHVAYIPDKKILGLSKLSRLVEIFSRRLQVQERLTTQIAEALNEGLMPKGVGVMVRCRHLCMESRGIERSKLVTVTTALRGVFAQGPAREEFLQAVATREENQ
jgi:GTP cyclohydrolase I